MQQLQKAEIASDLNKRRDMVLYYLKATGEYDPAVREWENKATADKTWPNIKIYISNKYARENKQTKISAKQFKANLIEEQAEITEELINNLTQAHTKQIKALIKSTTNAMKEMMMLVKANTNNQNQNNWNQNNSNAKAEEEKKKMREERN
jgi:hypothetical protein